MAWITLLTFSLPLALGRRGIVGTHLPTAVDCFPSEDSVSGVIPSEDSFSFGRQDHVPKEGNALTPEEINKVQEIAAKHKVNDLKANLKQHCEGDPYMDKDVHISEKPTLETVHALLHLLHYSNDKESCNALIEIVRKFEDTKEGKIMFDAEHIMHHSRCGEVWGDGVNGERRTYCACVCKSFAYLFRDTSSVEPYSQ
mmetsp:Transcript_114356/g.323313  ORF Transcript_114356/g.323313 Transcript_114356/m.323313 type:complete len:198 (+) Transcript_114356:79-672(+)